MNVTMSAGAFLIRVATSLCLLFACTALFGQSDPLSRSWNAPVPPFRIAGNLYYIGAADITAYLLTSPQGHIVLDGGFAETAPQILANIVTLGFRVEDVRVLLNSHAHLDHAGGLADLRRATGARFVASPADVPLLARGGQDDPQFADRFLFPPIYADGLVADRGRVTVGNVTMTAHLTPGHTPGCTTWETSVRDGSRRLNVVFACSPSVPGSYRLVGNPRYPNAADDYRRGFARLRELRPDIFLGSHGNFFRLDEKRQRLGDAVNPFIDRDGYRQFVTLMQERFESRLAEQFAEQQREQTETP